MRDAILCFSHTIQLQTSNEDTLMVAKRMVCFCVALMGTTAMYKATRVHAATDDGIYTTAQATHGAEIYKAKCALCHGSNMEGIGQAPSLLGDDFWSTYDDKPIQQFYDKIQKAMPADKPGSLSRPDAADVVAFIMSASKYPAGSAELPSEDDKLKTTQLPKPPKP
jgi:mono/diheme cytochrome c family protein